MRNNGVVQIKCLDEWWSGASAYELMEVNGAYFFPTAVQWQLKISQGWRSYMTVISKHHKSVLTILWLTTLAIIVCYEPFTSTYWLKLVKMNTWLLINPEYETFFKTTVSSQKKFSIRKNKKVEHYSRFKQTKET